MNIKELTNKLTDFLSANFRIYAGKTDTEEDYYFDLAEYTAYLNDQIDKKEQILTAGTNITIDRTDPENPVISSNGRASSVEDLTTIEDDTSLVLSPNGDGGVGWRAETGGTPELPGSGVRIVEASDGAGTLSATKTLTNAKLTDATAITRLTTTSNWDINGAYTGTAITGTFEGQYYRNDEYFFFAYADNDWIRMIRL